MKIETTMRSLSTTIRTDKMKKTDNTKCSKDVEQVELPYIVIGFNHFGKEFGSFFKS